MITIANSESSKNKEKNERNIPSFIMNLPLFSSLSSEYVNELFNDGDIYGKTYASDTIIYDDSTDSVNIDPGIIMNGSAAVFSSDSEKDICLRILSPGNLFGAVNMFEVTDKFISSVRAEKKCSVVFIKQSAFRRMLEENSGFMYDYFGFLAMRIEFLNRKIRQFTAGNADRRLAVYLDTISETDSFTLPFSYSKFSEMLDIGRASLYRALDTLSECGIISRNGKNITILNRDALRSYGCITKINNKKMKGQNR